MTPSESPVISFKAGNEPNASSPLSLIPPGKRRRPRDEGKHPGIIVLHGNPGIPEWVQNVGAQMAQAGYVGLVIDLNSRVVPDSTKLDKPNEFYRSNTFDRQVLQDTLAGIKYLRGLSFIREGGLGMVGFCGGGRKALMLPTQSEDVRVVVSFHGPVLYRRFRNAKDPMPEVMDVSDKIKVPVQGHYGLLDKIAPAKDAQVFEEKLKAQKTPVEMFYYEGAGHGFYDYSWRSEQDGAFGHHEDASILSHRRMVQFLKTHLKQQADS